MARKWEHHTLMAHFAELDENNIVLQVVVVENTNLDPSNEESSGIAYLESIFGFRTWKQTSFNAKFRGIYAGIGYFYDQELDQFIAPINEPIIYDEKISE